MRIAKKSITVQNMQIDGLLAEKPKDDADDDEHESHTNENTNHRRIDILKIGFLFLLS